MLEKQSHAMLDPKLSTFNVSRSDLRVDTADKTIQDEYDKLDIKNKELHR